MTSHLDQIKAQLDVGVQALGPATGGIHGPCVHVCGLSRVRLFVSSWIVALQGPPSMEFFRQEYWSGCHFLLQEDLPDPGNEPASSASPALQADSLPTEQPGKPWSLGPPSYCSRLLTSSETLVPAIHPVWLPSYPLHLLKSHPGFWSFHFFQRYASPLTADRNFISSEEPQIISSIIL